MAAASRSASREPRRPPALLVQLDTVGAVRLTRRLPRLASSGPAGASVGEQTQVVLGDSFASVASIDFDRAQAFVEAVPPGRWTSYKDVAAAGGNTKVMAASPAKTAA